MQGELISPLGRGGQTWTTMGSKIWAGPAADGRNVLLTYLIGEKIDNMRWVENML